MNDGFAVSRIMPRIMLSSPSSIPCAGPNMTLPLSIDCPHRQGARVHAAVLESETIRRRSRLQPDSPAGLRTGRVGFSVDEPYTCEVNDA